MTSDPASRSPNERLSDREYAAACARVLSRVEACVDAWLEGGVVDIDTHRAGGLLELEFPDRSKIVLNAQPPLQELWLAARSGGFHYRCIDGEWRDTRRGDEFFAALSVCASEQARQPLHFTAS